jgi:hypothetical protein
MGVAEQVGPRPTKSSGKSGVRDNAVRVAYGVAVLIAMAGWLYFLFRMATSAIFSSPVLVLGLRYEQLAYNPFRVDGHLDHRFKDLGARD